LPSFRCKEEGSSCFFDILLEEATSEGLIQKKIIDGLFGETTTTFLLAPKGRQYAIQHKLIQI
jgi:hypothetical protein